MADGRSRCRGYAKVRSGVAEIEPDRALGLVPANGEDRYGRRRQCVGVIVVDGSDEAGSTLVIVLAMAVLARVHGDAQLGDRQQSECEISDKDDSANHRVRLAPKVRRDNRAAVCEENPEARTCYCRDSGPRTTLS